MRESVALNDSLSKEVTSLWDRVYNAYDNQYAKTCDIDTLYKWEKFLDGLYGVSWEEKRKALLLLFSSKGYINEGWVVESVRNVMPEDRFVVLMDRKNYALTIFIKYGFLEYVSSIYKHLRERIPANLTLTIMEYFKTWSMAFDRGSWGDAKGFTWEDSYRFISDSALYE